MTSTASLASKNKKKTVIYILSDFPATRNLKDNKAQQRPCKIWIIHQDNQNNIKYQTH